METKQDYKEIGEKLKTAEFKGMVITKLKYIEESVNGLQKADEKHDSRIKDLENFQSNMVGKFTVIGAIVIMVSNWAWDIGRGVISSLKSN